MSCDECGTSGADHGTPSGRSLCDDCYQAYVQLAGATTALAGGSGVGGAVATGIASGAYAGASDAEVDAIRGRRTKLASTQGFWRRLYVRIVG
jgi:hypothetical protein